MTRHPYSLAAMVLLLTGCGMVGSNREAAVTARTALPALREHLGMLRRASPVS